MTDTTSDSILETNSYAIAYRLMGDRSAARAVAGIAAERVRQAGGPDRPDWLYLLVEFILDQTVETGSLTPVTAADDAFSGLRAALRRRLTRASPDERVAGSLVHLAGYPVDFVASIVHRSQVETAELAGVLAPPPGVAYRDLGDPELTRRRPQEGAPGRRLRRPHWTTIGAIAVVVAVIIAATQVTGPRPTLGPPVDEGGLAVLEAPAVPSGGVDPLSGTADHSPN